MEDRRFVIHRSAPRGAAGLQSDAAKPGGSNDHWRTQLLTLFAHYHGQMLNRDEVARSVGVDTKTVQRYLDVFAEAYLLRIFMPYEKNVGERVRRAPRIFFRSAGLPTLLRIHGRNAPIVASLSGCADKNE